MTASTPARLELLRERLRVLADYDAVSSKQPLDCDGLARLARRLTYIYEALEVTPAR